MKPSRILGTAGYLALLLCAAETASRVYLAVRHKVPPLCPECLADSFYPELRPLREHPPRRGDGTFDIALLGGSVLTPMFGSIPRELRRAFEERPGGPVRIHRLAQTAHGTRDSYLKYRSLPRARFDLVLVYHGINDVRANNCPPEVYRSDYSHYAWYRDANALTRIAPGGHLTLPFSFGLVSGRIRSAAAPNTMVTRSTLPSTWLPYGATVKTVDAFRANLASIARIAHRRGDRLVMMTFAYHVPPGYSHERFKRRVLDYRAHRLPVEIWGHPPNVVRAIDEHNRALRELVRHLPAVAFVDQETLIPKRGSFFDDIAHLTPAGCRLFVDNVVDAVAPTTREEGGR